MRRRLIRAAVLASSILLSGLAMAQFPPAPTGPLPENVETVLTLPGPGNTENITQAPDGTFYITGIGDKILWKITPGGEATNFFTSPSHAAFVGVVANEDEVVLGAFQRPFIRADGRGLDMSDVGSQIIVLDNSGAVKATIDGEKGQFFNGLADLGNGSYLIADTANPQILRVNTRTEEIDVWLTDPTISRPNGLKVHQGHAYVASNEEIYRVRIENGEPAGNLVLVAEGVRTDDFGIAPDGTIYIPTGTEMLKVTPAGEVSQFLGNVPNAPGAWVSMDGNYLYWASRAGPSNLFRVRL